MASEQKKRRAALVFNPVKADPDTLPGQVKDAAAAAGWDEPLILETTVEDTGEGATQKALDEGVDVILVAGGDGTVRAVSAAIAGSGVPLAIVPSGTGNLLARNLLLPLDSPELMVKAAFEGDEHAIDIAFAKITREGGDVEEHGFVVLGGMGLDAAMIANTSGNLKKKMGWVAYVDGAARSLVGAKPFPVTYQVAGRRLHRTNVQSIMVANCGSLPGGLELIPDASVSDGNLDVLIVQPKGPLGWVLVWRRVAWDNSVLRRFRAGRNVLKLRTKDNSVRYSRGPGVDIGTQQAQAVQLDGDEFGEATQLAARVEAGALKIMVPVGHVLPK